MNRLINPVTRKVNNVPIWRYDRVRCLIEHTFQLIIFVETMHFDAVKKTLQLLEEARFNIKRALQIDVKIG